MTSGEKRLAKVLEHHQENDYLLWDDVSVGSKQLHSDRGLFILEVKDWKLGGALKWQNKWAMSIQARFQHLLGRAQWNADAVCAEIRQYAVEHLKSQTDILAIDETGFLKQGEQSVGVQVQYYGTTGHLENCQVGVIYVLHQ
jgi:SRSO17 transposase